MKNCENCNAVIKENDKFCRNCGVYVPSKFLNMISNIFLVVLIIGILFFILLFVASYFVE